jgi:hypothetical protein
MKISNKRELDTAIIELEKRKLNQESALTAQFHGVYESMKPINLIKGLFTKVSDSPEIKSGLLKTITGIGIGILTKRLFIGKSSSFIGKIVSTALELGVAKTAISNTDKVKAYGTAIYNNLFKKKSKHKQLIL